MRYCSKCKIEKEKSEFNKDKSNKDGLCVWCRECRNKYLRNYKKKYVQTETYKIQARKDDKKFRLRHPDRIYAIIKRKREKYPIKYKANNKVSDAIHRKILIKKPCIICGETKVDAHHEDYNKPLDVIWLCRKHHWELHKNKRNRFN